MRMPFEQVFSMVDGHVVPHAPITIGHATYAAGVMLPPTVAVFGVELSTLSNCDFAVEVQNELIEIFGFFPDQTIPVAIGD